MEGIKIKSVTGIPTVKFWTLEEKNYKLASDLKMPKTKVYVKDTKMSIGKNVEHILEVYKRNGDNIEQITVKKVEINKNKASNVATEVRKNIKKLIEKHHPDIDELVGKFKVVKIAYRNGK